MVAAEQQQALTRVRQQHAWQGEAARVALEKLRRFFQGRLVCERFVLLPLGGSGEGVASIRAAALPSDVQVREADAALSWACAACLHCSQMLVTGDCL